MESNESNNEINMEKIQKRLESSDVHIGWDIRMDYTEIIVCTNDQLQEAAGGIARGSLLKIPVMGDPFAAILVRVVDLYHGSLSDEHWGVKFDTYTRSTNGDAPISYDPITQGFLQYSFLKCKIMGTFYLDDQGMTLGGDVDGFSALNGHPAYKPVGEGLARIVNHTDPNKLRHALEVWAKLGIDDPAPDMPIGVIRDSSTRFRSHQRAYDPVEFTIPATDLISKRTVVVGKTRTGKTNAVNTIVKALVDATNKKTGIALFDLSGEYTNPNIVRSTLHEVFPGDTVRYSLGNKTGFKPLNYNFYAYPQEALSIMKSVLGSQIQHMAQDVKTFFEGDFDAPDPLDFSAVNRYERRLAVLHCNLYSAGYEPPTGFTVRFKCGKKVLESVEAHSGQTFINPSIGMNFHQAIMFFKSLRTAHLADAIHVGSNGPWVDEHLLSMLNTLVRRTRNDGWINGFKVLGQAIDYHTPKAIGDTAEDIYNELAAGKIVLMDLSSGEPFLKEHISRKVAGHILEKATKAFTDGTDPLPITLVVEEAHNVIEATLPLGEVWPKIAKEGGKYGIGLVAITQEVSSLHKNVLAGCENWLVFHFNNKYEINFLCNYEDFEDFKPLIMANDVGHAIVRTLSRPVTTPVQIYEFKPEISDLGKEIA